MKKIDKNSLKLACIICLGVIMLVLASIGVGYAIANYNSDDVVKFNNNNVKFTLSADQLDAVEQPLTGFELTLDTLPKTTSYLTELDFKTFKKLFITSKKSLLFLVSDDNERVGEYLNVVNKVLANNKINAYSINISKLSEDELIEMDKYINYEVLPTTFTIEKSYVGHSLSGIVDEETLLSFIDYFYYRNN